MRQKIGSICELQPTQRIRHIYELNLRRKNSGKDKAETEASEDRENWEEY